jgi:cullin 3
VSHFHDLFSTILILVTSGYWPSQNVPQCILPVSVDEAIRRFSTFYLQKHTGRKLLWQTSTGSAEIRGTFGDAPKFRRHELAVSTYQMCILALFNEHVSQTLEQIKEKTNIPEGELRRHLISLCTPKHRILRKASRGKVIGANDSFSFHKEYTSKFKRVKIPLVSMKETLTNGDKNAASGDSGSGPAARELPKEVEEDRRHLVEAVVMRIMKARKTLHHNELIAEVTKQLQNRFLPRPQFVKKRVESLIERDYLERSEADRRVYVYLA